MHSELLIDSNIWKEMEILIQNSCSVDERAGDMHRQIQVGILNRSTC